MTTKENSQSDRHYYQPPQQTHLISWKRSAFGSFWISVLCFLVVVPRLQADPILFTFSGTGSGNLGGTPFADTPFSIQLYGDTINAPRIPDSASTFDIGQVGSGLFSVDMRINAFPNGAVGGGGVVAFGVQGGRDLLYLYGPALAGYDLARSFLPVTFATVGDDPIERFREIPTSVGPLSLFSARDVTFSATLVPEPSTMALVAMATLSLFIGSRALRKSR
jgi:hypothetical protein